VDSPSGSLSESPRRRLASTNNRMARPVGVWAQHGAQSQSTKAFQRLSGARMRRSASEAPRKRDGHVNLRRVRTRDARPPVRERAVGPCGCSCAVWPCARLCATGVVCVLLHRLGSPSPSPSPYSELADAGALSSLRVPSHCCRCALERQVPYIHTYIPHSLPPSGQPQESRRVWSFVASAQGFVASAPLRACHQPCHATTAFSGRCARVWLSLTFIPPSLTARLPWPSSLVSRSTTVSAAAPA